MPQSIKIPDDEMSSVRREAVLSSRSISGQVTHWLRIGRAIERAPDFSYARVLAALEGRIGPDALKGEEQEIYIADLLAASEGPTPEQTRFFVERKRAGKGVGADKRGRVVRQKASGA